MDGELLEKFYNSLIEKNNFSRNSILSYVQDIKLVIKFLGSDSIIDWIQEEKNIYKYIDELKKLNYSNSTITRRVVSINSFLLFLYQNNYISSYFKVSISNKKINKKENFVILSKKEINDFLNIEPSTFLEFRDKAIFELSYATGIKPTECIDIKKDDVNLDIGYIKYLNSKRKSVIVALPNETINVISRYILELEKKSLSTNYLFVSESGNKITRQAFWKIFKKRKEQLGISTDINPTVFRNSLAVHLLQENVAPENVKEFLGLTSLSSILNYIKKANEETLTRKILNCHPRNKMKE